MKRPKDTFVFPPELGHRLRELRGRAGLTQEELANLMGRTGRKAGNLVSRLELGRQKHPSLSIIADYLRACHRQAWQSSVRSASGILESFLRQPDCQKEIKDRN